MHTLTFDQFKTLLQSGVAGWPIFVTMWSGIFYFANRVAINRTKMQRENEQNAYARKREQQQMELEEIEHRKIEMTEKISFDFERRIGILVSASRRFRELLAIAMNRNDQLERWITILEAYVATSSPQLMRAKPEITPPVSAIDVAAVFAEQGNAEHM